ncbi:MAG TPA: CsgG/HfaB family protein [Spirochaetota bacterium]|nr:CsgG/HfaB family protein [Spirochaetota bacterium]HPJ34849.1 CsgG/HfaB family protein [Spirochaetota bacterium]
MKKMQIAAVISLMVLLPVQGSSYNNDDRVFTNIYSFIKNKLDNNKTVSLAIYAPVNQIGNSCKIEIDKNEWKRAIADELEHILAKAYIDRFSSYPEFTIVDRDRFYILIKEQELAQTGLLDDKMRLKMGKLLSINYLVTIGYSRYCVSGNVQNRALRKLINIETGKIEAIDTIQEFQESGWKGKDRIKITRLVVNGIDVENIKGDLYKK